MNSEDDQLDVVVVGAGPAGLTMARRLGEAGATFTVLERNGDVGGIWNIDAPGSPMYDSAHFISSRTLSGFPDFPMPDTYPDYPNHRQLLAYIRDFAADFDLRRHIRFDTTVERATPQDDGWVVQTDRGPIRSRYLVCANGVTWLPNEVTWPGAFDGEVRHSVTYRSPDEFRGRRVLIVGAGNSGVDIACDAAFAADAAFLSVRRGYHFIPKFIMGKPADVFAHDGPSLPRWLETRVFEWLLRLVNGDLTRLGLPAPDHRIFESHPIMNTQILHHLGHGDCVAKPDVDHLDGKEVVFVDGSRELVDLVITATGYQHAIPFLPDGLLPMAGGRPDLYLNVFPRGRDDLAVIGFVEFASAAYATFDQMAHLVVKDIAGDRQTRDRLRHLKRTHQPDLRGGHRYLTSPRHANYVDADTYRATLDDVTARVGSAAGGTTT